MPAQFGYHLQFIVVDCKYGAAAAVICNKAGEDVSRHGESSHEFRIWMAEDFLRCA